MASSLGLICMGCGQTPNRILRLNLLTPPRLIIAYALCADCGIEETGEKARAEIREAVGVDSPERSVT